MALCHKYIVEMILKHEAYENLINERGECELKIAWIQRL